MDPKVKETRERAEQIVEQAGLDPKEVEGTTRSLAQVERREFYAVYPRWKRAFNPLRRVLYAFRHRFGKWRNIPKELR